MKRKENITGRGPIIGDVFESCFFTWCYTFLNVHVFALHLNHLLFAVI